MYNVYPLWKFITCAETAGTINPIRKPAKIARIIPKNEKLKAFLLNTGIKILVEASPYDKIWGIGLSADQENIENPLTWNGENLLGFVLMEVRDSLNQ